MTPLGSNNNAGTAGPQRVARFFPLVLFGGLALVPLAGPFASDRYVTSLLARIMIYGMAALALDLIIGFGALVSFGHAAYIGIGAYAVGIAAAHGQNGMLPTVALALAASGLFAGVTGAICLRTRGVAFIMITLAFAQMAYFVASSLKAYGGDDGLVIDSRVRLFDTGILEDRIAFYYLVYAILLVVYLLCRRLVDSRFGRVLRATKDNILRTQAIGFYPFPFQLCAYVISGMIAGMAGFLLANQSEFVSPAYMSWQRSGDLIVMVMLGGVGTLYGGIIGAGLLFLIEEGLSHFTEHWKIMLGPLLLLVVMFGRGGVVGLLRGHRLD
jgi:branched-chain amino acid transport system permease protein